MLYWKKMPSLWIGNRLTEFNSLETSHAIAAIKIYITFCLFGKEEDDGVRTVKLTFTEISEIASISRSLVNEGLKLLDNKKLIKYHRPRQKERKSIQWMLMGAFMTDGVSCLWQASLAKTEQSAPSSQCIIDTILSL